LIRKKLLKVPDLYKGSEGIYWYTNGWNFRTLIALFVGSALCIPGFIMTCIDQTADNVWVEMFQICWFIAAPFALILYYALNHFWPPAGLGIHELLPTDDASVEVIEGVASDEVKDDKTPVETTKPASEGSVV
jgi:cytosine/uracil/thiamine/allantoin permease